MSTILFIIVIVLIFGYVAFDKLNQEKKWILLMTAPENRRDKLNEKYSLLKSNNINCIITSGGSRGTSQSTERREATVRDSQSVNLEVYYKDLHKAEELINSN